MNSTDDPLTCICLPNEWSISISIIGILLPLFISEVLPFCPCDPNGIFHALFLKCKIKPRNQVAPK